jgi:tRNA(adenine34) deaminase
MSPATMRDRPPAPLRRRAIIGAASAALCVACPPSSVAAGDAPDIRWYRAADAMKKLAETWGDQPYGAVVVQDGVLVGEGPSRVAKDGNPDAHAERVAIRDALARLQRQSLDGAILYSTSRPCSACETAAAKAGISRMIFGPELIDAGRPRGG